MDKLSPFSRENRKTILRGLVTTFIRTRGMRGATCGTRLSIIITYTYVYLRYFEEPKGEELSRSIADGTPLNEMCNRPPCLNFPAIAEIIHVIANFPNVNFLSADMRHWFHQIEIPSESGRTSVRRSICNEITENV